MKKQHSEESFGVFVRFLVLPFVVPFPSFPRSAACHQVQTHTQNLPNPTGNEYFFCLFPRSLSLPRISHKDTPKSSQIPQDIGAAHVLSPALFPPLSFPFSRGTRGYVDSSYILREISSAHGSSLASLLSPRSTPRSKNPAGFTCIFRIRLNPAVN